MGIIRAEVIARMRGAISEGLSASRFIRDMKEVGLSYRRTNMLADWRRETGAKEKAGLLRYVRRDRYPTTKVMAGLAPEASREFLYKIKVHSVIQAGEPFTERFVNIMSDVPLTPTMIEEEVVKQWREWERYKAEEISGLQVWSVFKKGL